MIDLDDTNRVHVPPYKIKAGEQEREYDALQFAFDIRVLEGVEDPTEILKVLRQVLNLTDDIKLSTFDACLILKDFKDFSDTHLDEPLKKVFGRSLFSTTTTDSNPETSTPEI